MILEKGKLGIASIEFQYLTGQNSYNANRVIIHRNMNSGPFLIDNLHPKRICFMFFNCWCKIECESEETMLNLFKKINEVMTGTREEKLERILKD